MKVAIVGSRGLEVEIEKYLPKDISLIISGGTRGIDTLTEKYADKNGIPKLIFKPDYIRYGKSAPLIRNKLMVQNADLIVAIWNGVSAETKYAIDYSRSLGKKVRLVLIDLIGMELLPGNLGKDCLGNGEHFDESGRLIECCCNECDFLQCCLDGKHANKCIDCQAEYCPRKFQ